MVGIFIQWELANTTKSDFSPSQRFDCKTLTSISLDPGTIKKLAVPFVWSLLLFAIVGIKPWDSQLLSYIPSHFYFFYFEKDSRYVAEVSLELAMLLL